MNNFIKFASIELNKPDDIIRTAGILRMLKNKFLSMFDDDKAENINRMLETTNNIKPLLSEAYRLIKKVENAINDLDIADYNANIELLKAKLNDLNAAVNNANEIMPKVEESKTEHKDETNIPAAVEDKQVPETKNEPIKDGIGVNLLNNPIERVKDLPEGAAIYKGINTLSELGVTKNDIVPNAENYRQFAGSWAKKAMERYTQEQMSELIKDQDHITPGDIKTIFYDRIPEMKIKKIMGREINSVDDPRFGKKGTPKPGYLEIRVEGAMLPLPEPIDYWKVKMVFILVDRRKTATDRLTFKIYKQYVVAVRNDMLEETYLGNKPEESGNE